MDTIVTKENARPNNADEFLLAACDRIADGSLRNRDEMAALGQSVRERGIDATCGDKAESVRLACALYRHFWPIAAQKYLEPFADELRERCQRVSSN